MADAETLPYPDDTFDLVVGHAVLHHIPDLDQAMREILRVLKPGGRFVFAGEPTAKGDFVARNCPPTWNVAKRVTHLPGLRGKYAKTDTELDESSRAALLEAVVDVHTFDGRTASAVLARRGGRRAHGHRGVHRLLVRMAGAHDRSSGKTRFPGLQMGVLRVRHLAGAVRPRREGHEQDRPRAVLLQRECDRNQGVSRDPRNARFTWASVKWIVRNRAWSWWYLVRYWRFLWLKVRHRHIITEGSSSSVGIANCMPAKLRPVDPRAVGARGEEPAAGARGEPCESATRRCSAATTRSTHTWTSRSG